MAGFAATHTVPEGGLPAWDLPDPAAAPSARLDRWLEVRVTGTHGGWTRVLCANGWSAWVDGNKLVAVGAAAAPAPAPVSAVPVGPAPIGLTTWMAIGGGIAVGLSAVLPWISLNLGAFGAVSVNAFKAPLEVLWNMHGGSAVGPGATSPLSIGLALIAVGAVGVAAVFVPGLDLVRRGAGGIAVLIASDFVRQMSAALGQLNSAGGGRFNILSVLGLGVYLALAGGVLMLLGTTRKPAAAQA